MWYNSTDNLIKYYNGTHIHVVGDTAEVENLVTTDIERQRLEQHENTVGVFADVQGDTAVPATQANVIDNTQFLTARQDQRTPDGAFINTYDSLTFRVDADGDVIEAVVIDPSLSGSEAGRRAALSWWTTELNNGGPITFSGLQGLNAIHYLQEQ